MIGLSLRLGLGLGSTLTTGVVPGVERFRLNFATDTYTLDGASKTQAEALVFSRSSVKNVMDVAGLYTSVSANELSRSNLGVLPEATRTNVVRWNRDLTNAVWTKVNATVAKDQVGIDGVANAASRMTATENDATVTQAITVSASNRWFSVFLTRISGAGALTVTVDGVNYYPAVQIEGDRYFVQLPTGLYYESMTNPVVGFKMAVNGDSWRVDAVQFENSSIGASSPIFTTTASASRAADTLSLSDAFRTVMSMQRGTILAKVRNLSSLRAIGTYPQVINARIDATNKVGIEVGTGIVDATVPPQGWTSAEAGHLQAFIPYKDSLFVQKQYSSGLCEYDTEYRVAVSWDIGLSRGAFSNGTSSLKTEGVGAFDDITPVFVGIGNNNGGQHGGMYIAEIVYYDGMIDQSALDAYVA